MTYCHLVTSLRISLLVAWYLLYFKNIERHMIDLDSSCDKVQATFCIIFRRVLDRMENSDMFINTSEWNYLQSDVFFTSAKATYSWFY